MADENQLENEILDFDNDALPELPEDNPFEAEKPGRPWLLIGIGLVTTILVAVIVLKLFIGRGDEAGLMEIPIDTAPVATAPGGDSVNDAAVDADTIGMPTRVVEPRKQVTFDPDKPVVQRPKPRPIGQGGTQTQSTSAQTSARKSGVWSAQVGAYNSRAAAESGQRQMQSGHQSLFSGQSLAILTAVMPNGQTVYRLRVMGFENSNAANGFCVRARAENVDCYATK